MATPNFFLSPDEEDALAVERMVRQAYPEGIGAPPQSAPSPNFRTPRIPIPFSGGRSIPGANISGGALDAMSLAMLQAMQQPGPQPTSGGGRFAQGFMQGFAGSRVNAARGRQAQFEAAQEQFQKRKAAEQSFRESAIKAVREGRQRQAMQNDRLAFQRDIRSMTSQQSKGQRLTAAEAKAMGEGYDTVTEYPANVKAEAMNRTAPQKSAGYDIGFDPSVIAAGIVRGELPPTESGYSRGQFGKVATQIQQDFPGFNLARARSAWNATQKHVNAMNSRQQLQLHNSATAVREALPELVRLNDELSKMIPRGSVVPLNQLATRGTQLFGAGGQKAQVIAGQMLTIMNTIEPELGNVYRAGGVPTDQAMRLVHQIFNLNLPPAVLAGNIEKETWMLNVRMNALENSRPATPGGGENPYAPPATVGVTPQGGTPKTPPPPGKKNMFQQFKDTVDGRTKP